MVGIAKVEERTHEKSRNFFCLPVTLSATLKNSFFLFFGGCRQKKGPAAVQVPHPSYVEGRVELYRTALPVTLERAHPLFLGQKRGCFNRTRPDKCYSRHLNFLARPLLSGLRLHWARAGRRCRDCPEFPGTSRSSANLRESSVQEGRTTRVTNEQLRF